MIRFLLDREHIISAMLGITAAMAFTIVAGTAIVIWYRVLLLHLGLKNRVADVYTPKSSRLAPLDVKILLNCLSFVLMGFALRYALNCLVRLDVTDMHLLMFEAIAFISDAIVIVSSLIGIRSVTYSVCGNSGVNFFIAAACISAVAILLVVR